MRLTEIEVGAGAYGVIVANDGAVWTTCVESGELVRLDLDGSLTRIGLDSPASRPMVLANGADNDLWFTRGDGFLGHVDSAGAISARPVATVDAAPYGVCAGPEHSIWYTLLGQDGIGCLAADGQMEELSLTPGSMPSMICPGPDGALWFTVNQANAICAITHDKSITTYPLPSPNAAPIGISASQDSIWFTEIGAGQIGRIRPGGVIQEFALPDRLSRPHAVAATRDGGCWTTLWARSSAVRVDRDGHIIDGVDFAPGSEPHGLVVASDESVWVALESGALAHLTHV